VHLVDDQYDHGRILAQARVPVLAGDSPEALQKRVYEQEMRLYPLALEGYIRTAGLESMHQTDEECR
jgi:phosphoribosylglycinamide formyltransferase-1